MANLRTIMTRRRLLQLALAVSVSLFLFFLVRAIVRFYRFRDAADEPIEPWMSIGYVSRAHHIDPQELHDLLGLPPDRPDRRPLGEIAKDRGMSSEDFIKKVNAAVLQLKAKPKQKP